MTANARRATGARNESLQSAAMRLYDEAGRNSEAAEAALVLEIRKRPALHDEAFHDSARLRIAGLRSTDRAAAMSGKEIGSLTMPTAEVANDQPVTFKPQSAKSVAASNAAFKRFAVTLTGIYLTPFKFGGQDIILGKATPEELRPVAAHYLGQGATMVRTARWLEKIIASAKDGSPIHTSLGLKDIERMKDDAFSSSV
jgi:hypothetical protein